MRAGGKNKKRPGIICFRVGAWAVVVLSLITGLSMAGRNLWNAFSEHPAFLLSIDDVAFEMPDCIKEDAMGQLIRSEIEGLVDGSSILDLAIAGKIEKALLDLPWILEVRGIERLLPNALHLELRFRKPVAAVKESREGRQFFHIDKDGFWLPDDLYALPKLQHQRKERPFIHHAHLTHHPPRGKPWEEHAGALAVGARLKKKLEQKAVVDRLELEKIDVTRVGTAGRELYAADVTLVTETGTSILWGTTDEYSNIPGLQRDRRVDEPSDSTKIERLMTFTEHHPRLQNIRHVNLQLQSRITYKLSSD